MKTVIYLIRHGESEANVNGIFAGSADFLLTKKGIKQAEITAKAISKAPVTAVFASPLRRARKTAEAFSSVFHCQVTVREDLKEIFCGEWEGKTYEAIEAMYPDMFPGPWYRDFGVAKAPGGESVIDGGHRFYNAVKQIAEENKDRFVLIAAHAGVIRSFYGIVSKIAPEDLGTALPFPTNASYSVVRYEDGIFYPVIYSEDSALQEQNMVTALKE